MLGDRRYRPFILIISCAILLMVIFKFLENILLYHPYRAIDTTPSTFGIAFEDVFFQAADGTKLNGWFVPPASPSGPVILWAHGNAGNLSHRSENVASIRTQTAAGVFLFDYRGYGQSEGKPGEEGLYEDGRGAYRWLRERVPADRIFLFGRSLGAAVVLKIAVEGAEAKGLILESPFESLLAMGKEIFPFLPVSWLIRQKFDNASLISAVQIPVLVLHGDSDEIVPYSQGQRIFDLAPSPKRFFKIRGAGHNDTYLIGGADYWKAWRAFLESPESNH